MTALNDHKSIRQRRPRGTGKMMRALNVHVAPDSKSKIDIIADALGLGQGQVLDLILENLDVDADGRPAFWDGPLASELDAHDHYAQEEFQLASTA